MKRFNLNWPEGDVKKLDDALAKRFKGERPARGGGRGRSDFLHIVFLDSLKNPESAAAVGRDNSLAAVRLRALGGQLLTNFIPAVRRAGDFMLKDPIYINDPTRFLAVLEKKMLREIREWADFDVNGSPLGIAVMAAVINDWPDDETPPFSSWATLREAADEDERVAELLAKHFLRILREEYHVPRLTMEEKQ